MMPGLMAAWIEAETDKQSEMLMVLLHYSMFNKYIFNFWTTGLLLQLFRHWVIHLFIDVSLLQSRIQILSFLHTHTHTHTHTQTHTNTHVQSLSEPQIIHSLAHPLIRPVTHISISLFSLSASHSQFVLWFNYPTHGIKSFSQHTFICLIIISG